MQAAGIAEGMKHQVPLSAICLIFRAPIGNLLRHVLDLLFQIGSKIKPQSLCSWYDKPYQMNAPQVVHLSIFPQVRLIRSEPPEQENSQNRVFVRKK
jgi:hypothetical protein